MDFDTRFLIVLLIGSVIFLIVESIVEHIKEKKIEVKNNIIRNLENINSTYIALIDDSINDYYIVTTVGKHKYVKMLAEVKNGNEIIIYETTDKSDIKLLKEFAEKYELKTFNNIEEYQQEKEKADRKADKIKIISVTIISLMLLSYVFLVNVF